MTLRFFFPERQYGPDVVVRIPAHVADPDRKPVSHADDAQLRDRVLFEKLRDKLLRVAECEEVSRRTEVLLRHGGGEVQDEDQVSYNAAL